MFRPTRAIFFGCLAASLAASVAWAQFGGGGAQRSTPATQLPESGRLAPGSVTTQQQAGPTPGTNVVRSSIQIGGDFEGSVQSDKIPAGTVTLTLADDVPAAYDVGSPGCVVG